MKGIASLPVFIINNHIIPFLYQPQPADLLADLLDYTETIKVLLEPEKFHLQRDIVTSYYWFYFESFCAILSRYVMIKENQPRLDKYIHRFHRWNLTKSFKILWGMMRIEERHVVLDRINEEVNLYHAI